MNVAVIRNNTVANIIVCESVELSQQLLPDALCIDGGSWAIGDKYDKTIADASAPPNPDADRDAMIVDQEYRLTLLELGVN